MSLVWEKTPEKITREPIAHWLDEIGGGVSSEPGPPVEADVITLELTYKPEKPAIDDLVKRAGEIIELARNSDIVILEHDLAALLRVVYSCNRKVGDRFDLVLFCESPSDAKWPADDRLLSILGLGFLSVIQNSVVRGVALSLPFDKINAQGLNFALRTFLERTLYASATPDRKSVV